MTPNPNGRENPSVATLVVVARVILVLAAAGLVLASFALVYRDDSATAAATVQYACPMHPEVTASGPAQCSICKMELEPLKPRKPGSSETGPSEPAEPADPAKREAPPDPRHAYICPMHPDISAETAGQCPTCKMDLEPMTAENPEPPTAGSIPIAPHFAPGVTWLPETFPPAQPGTAQDRPPIGVAKRRAFVTDVRSAAWLEGPGRLAAVLYRDELIGLAAGEQGRFYPARSPRASIAVRLSDEPPSAWDASTSLVRFVVEAGQEGARDAVSGRALESRAGDVGWLELPSKSRELVVVPESALLRSTEGPYVVVPGADGHSFVRRHIEIGRILAGHVVVLSGLQEGDKLVVGKAFFLDAAARLESRAEPVAKVAP
jgi:hypothetical protein